MLEGESISVLLLGSEGVGKSSAIRAFTSKEETGLNGDINVPMTIDEYSLILQVWDMHSTFVLTESFLSSIRACALVFDLTDYQSLKDLRYWFSKISEYSIPCLLVGNKSDLASQIAWKKICKKRLQMKNIQFIRTSALSKDNISHLFKVMAKLGARYPSIQPEKPKSRLCN